MAALASTKIGFAASLDKMIGNRHIHWIDHDIEEIIKAGFTPKQLMGIVAKWLFAKKAFDALKLAALAIIHAGGREDLNMLNISIEPKDRAESLIADTRFAVKRRSLL
jgi:hypothetical protein